MELFMTVQRYDFYSNSQQLLYIKKSVEVVYDGAKILILQQFNLSKTKNIPPKAVILSDYVLTFAMSLKILLVLEFI